jgi:putative addiction module component (TIGR02574 family)
MNTMQRAEILKAALELPDDERETLIDELAESLPGVADADVEQAWAVEIERRIAEVESGKVKMIPWAEVEKEILEDLRTIRGR